MATNLEILAEFGFGESETGGGCTAWTKQVSDGTEIMVTDYDDECTSPTDKTVKFCVGHYDTDNNEIDLRNGTFDEMINHIQTILMEAGDPSQ